MSAPPSHPGAPTPGAPRDPPVASARRAMRLVADTLTRAILLVLAEGLARPRDLGERLRIPSEGTLHSRLGTLREDGVVAKRKHRTPPLAVDYELTAAGRALLGAIDAAAAWLGRRPDGPLALEGEEASKALGALADGWGSAILQHLARDPLTLTELEQLIAGPTHFAFKGLLRRLALHGLVVAIDGSGRGHRYELSEWGRLGVATLAAAARWERTHLPEETAPVSVADAVAATLIALPLVRPPKRAAGVCELAFEADGDRDDGDPDAKPALVHATIESGRPTSFATGPGPPPAAWARGSIGAWFTAVLDGRPAALQLGGERDLATAVVGELHRRLYGVG